MVEWQRAFKATAGTTEAGLEKCAFVELVKSLLRDRGDTATPSDEDLDAAFDLADESVSGSLCEGEFVNLMALVKAGKVAGLGSTSWFWGIDFEGKQAAFKAQLSLLPRRSSLVGANFADALATAGRRPGDAESTTAVEEEQLYSAI